eukprot:Seg2030.2 transcript_id=Seg2030.2/GoldUCD/mRNA.D3Y31 product="THAP domain-containing protein 4" protein_id=Seg2030.2/GoldUCD/D3Y31
MDYRSWNSRLRGRSCVAGAPNGESCMNTQFTKDVSIHAFPNENTQALSGLDLQWVRFVCRHRPMWKASKSSIFCSVHFEESCFTMRQEIARDLGMKGILKPDAVPSIDAANIRQGSATMTECKQRKELVDHLIFGH